MGQPSQTTHEAPGSHGSSSWVRAVKASHLPMASQVSPGSHECAWRHRGEAVACHEPFEGSFGGSYLDTLQ
jgi:hypothetical protein